MLWLSSWSNAKFLENRSLRGITFGNASGPPALGCRVGKQSNDDGVRSCLRSRLRRCVGKSASDGDVRRYGKSVTLVSSMYSRFVLAIIRLSELNIAGIAKRIHGL